METNKNTAKIIHERQGAARPKHFPRNGLNKRNNGNSKNVNHVGSTDTCSKFSYSRETANLVNAHLNLWPDLNNTQNVF